MAKKKKREESNSTKTNSTKSQLIAERLETGVGARLRSAQRYNKKEG